MLHGRLSSASDFLKQYAEPGVRLKTELTDNGGCFDIIVTAQSVSLGAKECRLMTGSLLKCSISEGSLQRATRSTHGLFLPGKPPLLLTL